MKRILTTLTITILTSFALAISPNAASNLVFDRLYAMQVDCDEFSMLQDIYGVTQEAYCGIMNDTYTNTNKNWTTDQYQDMGYWTLTQWETDYYDGPMISHMRGFNNGDYMAFVVLIEVPDIDSTFIILGYEPF